MTIKINILLKTLQELKYRYENKFDDLSKTGIIFGKFRGKALNWGYASYGQPGGDLNLLGV